MHAEPRRDQVGGLRSDIDSERVVVFGSNITDIRPITRYLERHNVAHRVVRMGMGSQVMRDRFAQLEHTTGWRQLPQIFIDGQFVGGYDEFFAYDFDAPKNKARPPIPVPALCLGVGGVVPFLLGATGLWWGPLEWRSNITLLLLTYSAIILTFIGAVHWGLAMKSSEAGSGMWSRLGISVVPALIAWISFSQTPISALLILTVAFVGQYVVDIFAVRNQWAPTWYLPLRSGLTAVVTVCLLVSLLALSTQNASLDVFLEPNASDASLTDEFRSRSI